MIIAIQIILLIVAGMSKAIMDTLHFHYDKSIFKKFNKRYWNPTLSWQNKWKYGITGVEKFMFSSTILVFITDGFHLAQWVFLNSTFLSMSLSTNLTGRFYYDFLIIRGIVGTLFFIGYNKVLIAKKNG